jgi:uncharacterized BrkB/YihY/UPF0761 family membrane protein
VILLFLFARNDFKPIWRSLLLATVIVFLAMEVGDVRVIF